MVVHHGFPVWKDITGACDEAILVATFGNFRAAAVHKVKKLLKFWTNMN